MERKKVVRKKKPASMRQRGRLQKFPQFALETFVLDQPTISPCPTADD